VGVQNFHFRGSGAQCINNKVYLPTIRTQPSLTVFESTKSKTLSKSFWLIFMLTVLPWREGGREGGRDEGRERTRMRRKKKDEILELT